MKSKIDLINGNITLSLLKLSIPIIMTNFIQTAYGMVDMIWIGKLGSDAVAAIGTASFFINLALALFTLVIIGTGVKIAQSVGAGKVKECNEFIQNSFVMTIGLAILYSLIAIILKDKLIGIYGLEPQTHKMAVEYLVISLVGIIFMYMNSLLSTILNSLGDSKTPFKANTIGFLLNIFLDPILILGVGNWNGFGVFGAGLATLISRILVLAIFILINRKVFKILFSKYNIDFEKLKKVVKMGVPVAAQRVIFVFISMAIGKIVVEWGATAIAVQKVGVQIESISYMTIGGLQGAIATFVGQNFGAGKIDRIKEGYKKALSMTVIFGGIVTLVFLIFPREIFSIFMEEKEALDMGVAYMRILSLSQIFMCMELLTVGAFNGIGKTYAPPIVSIIFTGARIPIAIILSSIAILGLNGIWLSISLSSFIKGIMLVIWFAIVLKNLKSCRKNNIEI